MGVHEKQQLYKRLTNTVHGSRKEAKINVANKHTLHEQHSTKYDPGDRKNNKNKKKKLLKRQMCNRKRDGELLLFNNL